MLQMGGGDDSNGPRPNVLHRRHQQLLRWDESETNAITDSIKDNTKVKFPLPVQFLAACSNSDMEEVNRLLKLGIDINVANVDGLTALHQACIDNDLELVKFLVQHKANVDAQDNEGWTPLHATASCGYMEVAKYLIESGASLGAVSYDVELPLDVGQGSDMLQFLHDEMDRLKVDATTARAIEEEAMLADIKVWTDSGSYKPDIDPRNRATPLHVAASKEYLLVMRALIKVPGVDINAVDSDGWAPLHAAAHWGKREACRVLADSGGDMQALTFANQSLFDVAEDELIPFLRSLTEEQRTKRSQQIPIAEITPKHDPAKRRSSVTRMSVDEKHDQAQKNVAEERERLRRHDIIVNNDRDDQGSNIITNEDEQKPPIPPSSSKEQDDLKRAKEAEIAAAEETRRRERERVAAEELEKQRRLEQEKELEKQRRLEQEKEEAARKLREAEEEEARRKAAERDAEEMAKRLKATEEEAERLKLQKAFEEEQAEKRRLALEEAEKRRVAREEEDKRRKEAEETAAKKRRIEEEKDRERKRVEAENLRKEEEAKRAAAEEERRRREIAAEKHVISSIPEEGSINEGSEETTRPQLRTRRTHLTEDEFHNRRVSAVMAPSKADESESQRSTKARHVRSIRRSTQGVTQEEMDEAKKLIGLPTTTPPSQPAATNNSSDSTDLNSDNSLNPAADPPRRGNRWPNKTETSPISSSPLTTSSSTNQTRQYDPVPMSRTVSFQPDPNRTATATTGIGSNTNSVTSSVTARPRPNSYHTQHPDSPAPSSSSPSSRPLSTPSSVTSSAVMKLSTPGSSTPPITSNNTQAFNDHPVDYKKLYEDEKAARERLERRLDQQKRELSDSRSEVERVRNSRTSTDTSQYSSSASLEAKRIERKLSEYELQMKEIEKLKADNLRMKDENSSLIRVISKLSK